MNIAGGEFAGSYGPEGFELYKYVYPRKREFQRYANEGIKLIRVPFKHKRLMLENGTWTADLARLKEVLVFAQETGCKVILDPHDYFKNPYTGAEYTSAELSAFLVPLANEVASYPALVGFTLTNEPEGSSDYWNKTAKPVMLAIHNAQPDLTIVLPGASYSSVTRWWDVNPLFPFTDLPSTLKVVYEGHLYMDERASGTWGTAPQDTKDRYQYVAPDHGVKMATAWVNWLQHHKLQGFIGETGVPFDNPSALVALDNLYKYLVANKIPATYWAGGEWWELNYVNAIERGGNFKEQMTVLRKHVDPALRPTPYVPAPIAYGPSAPSAPTDPTPDPDPGTGTAWPLTGMNIASTSDNPKFDAAGWPTPANTAYRRPSTDFAKWDVIVQPAIDAGKPWIARIGIAGERMIKSNFGALDEEYLRIIKEEIAFLHSKGAFVVLELHNYGRWWKKVTVSEYNAYPGTKEYAKWDGKPYTPVPVIWAPIGSSYSPITNDGLADMWRKIADRLKGTPGLWAYGLMNEPHNSGGESFFNVENNWTNVLAQKLVTAVRQVDTETWITINGNFYSSAKRWVTYSDGLKNVNDPYDKLIYEAHQYNDDNNDGGGQWKNRTTAISVEEGLNGVRPFINWLKANGKRGYLGEFGGPTDVPNQQTFLRALQDLLIANRIPYTQWRAGGGMPDNDVLGMNRSNGTIHGAAVPLQERVGATTTKLGPN